MDHPPEYEYRVTYRLSGGRPNGALAASDEEHAARIAGTLRRWKGHEGIAIERRLAAPWHPVYEPDDAPLGDARVAVFDVTVTPPNTYSDQGSIGIDVTYRGIAGVTEVPHCGSAVRVRVNLDDPINDPF
ncbi:MAG: hypothetical protein K1X38_01920 [Microthrixaceae bacterium]|nr:hypothetical protein [Microthrixaceae bacterium]